MSYQVYRPASEEWDVQPPIPELKAMLDRHPAGVSFIVEGEGIVQWRKTPRDTELIDAIRETIRDHSGYFRASANAVYDLLEDRGLV